MNLEKLEIILRDEWLAYETRELVRLFVEQHRFQITIDPAAHIHSPVTLPGLVCDCDQRDDRDFCTLQLKTERKDKAIVIQLPNIWHQNASHRREVKRRYKEALYGLMQQMYPAALPWGILTGVRPVKLAHQLMLVENDSQKVVERLEHDYLVSPSKARLLAEITAVQAPLLSSVKPRQVSVYIGIPLCPSRCSYCSFISQAVRGADDPLIGAYGEALQKELQGALAWLQETNREIDTLYIGGGTPSVLSAGQMEDLLKTLSTHWDLSQIREITFEAGRPDTLDREKLQILRRYPVHRLSINPQSLQPETLVRINRCHTVEQFYEAWHLAKEMGFETLNLDLIIGLPGENEQHVLKTLTELESLQPDNLTVHALALKRSSELKTSAAGQSLQDEAAQELMEQVYRFTEKLGLRPYYLYRQKEMAGHLENVGFSHPGKEGLYNVLMMEEKQTIMGLGAGAVSKLYHADTDRIQRLPQIKDVPLYIQRMKDHGFARQMWQEAFAQKE